MKKQLIYIILLFAVCSACSDWLDVRPRNEMKENDMYAHEEGFKSAMTGAYIQVASEELYGRDASMKLPDMLANLWTISTDKTSLSYNLGNFNFTHSEVETAIEKMWKKYYQAIVHLNNTLGNLKSSGVTFTYNNDKLIEGEALGLRAFLHLDLLRMFGPAPDKGKANSGIPAIPYAEEMTKEPGKLQTISYGEVCQKIIRDLDAAEKLLEIDPILTSSVSQLNNPARTWDTKPEDEWQFYRQCRFNYYAVKAAKARFYHWTGDVENAVKYARQVIEAKNEDGSAKFVLATEASYSTAGANFGFNLVMLCENIFGVHNPDHQSIVQPLFKDQSASLTQTTTNVKNAYETGANPDDIRNKGIRYWEEKTYQNSAKTNHFRKYTGTDAIQPQNIVPLLRLAEMYFILIEDLPVTEAAGYFKTFRISRSMDSSLDNTLTDDTAVRKRLESEYRKDFFGEGQLYYFYKKHNYTAYTWPKSVNLPANIYEVPIPKSQSVFD